MVREKGDVVYVFVEISALFDFFKLLGGDMAEGAALRRIFPLMNIAADGADPLFDGSRSRSGRLLGEILKYLGAVLADGADIVLGESLTLIDIAADGALPALFGSGLGSIGLDGGLVIAVGARRSIGENLAVHHFTDK